ncbi:hypothetical protein V1283_005230 [Bradyrhizobium sp. AZCC 2262]|uniref:hypothetical protein n=1 Tax=Bradyrhizobium sp. AZCC 2262 TaxID=3117022 RepID=UPI002FF3E760
MNGRFFETGHCWLRQVAGFLSKLASGAPAIRHFSCGRRHKIQSSKIMRPRPGSGSTTFRRGGAEIGSWALPLVNAVFANEISKLGQKLPKPGILFDQRMSFVGVFVATKGGLVPTKGILKQ